MNKLKIEALGKQHDRKKFNCGVEELNNYLRTTASQHAKKGISRTFVFIETDNPSIILGFVTLTACEIVAESLPHPYHKKFPSKVTGAKIGRLAVSRKFQKQGLGNQLIVFALHQAIIVHQSLGLTGVMVDAKDEQAKRYYQQYGFISLPENSLVLFLPMQSIINAFQNHA
ncbi:MAG: GNAT family N-acetyltransferase [Proteobacteria bacterium]|nr:GNAT family N-acetyltransferase [Pseudomonadota bacterium]